MKNKEIESLSLDEAATHIIHDVHVRPRSPIARAT